MRTKRAPCRARGMKGGDGFEAANEAAMAAEAAQAHAHRRTTSFGALRGRAGGLIAPERVAMPCDARSSPFVVIGSPGARMTAHLTSPIVQSACTGGPSRSRVRSLAFTDYIL